MKKVGNTFTGKIYQKTSIGIWLMIFLLTLPLIADAQGKIAFTSNNDRDIYVMNADGSNRTNLTNHPGEDLFASISPNGSKIAFTSVRDGNYEIYVMNADGSNQINLSNNPAWDESPSFSPDGSKILFTSLRDGNFEIYIMNADGSNQINLTNHPAFEGSASFSPDGSKIVFFSARNDGFGEIYIMNADGSNQTNLTNHPAWDTYPSFSPDGSKIAFSSDRDGNYEVYLMNPDGSNPINLTNHPARDTSLSFSPNGSKIAFTSERDGNGEIYVMNADGSNPINLTNNPEFDYLPSWGVVPIINDTTPPLITPNVVGTLGNNNWFVSDVQVSWSVIDNESPVGNQNGCQNQIVNQDTNGITFTCSATSAGGTNIQSVTIKRDATRPNIIFNSRSPAQPNANGWNNTDVTIAWDCSDQLTGGVYTSFFQVINTEGANQNAVGTCTDNAGNSASDTQTGINIDRTPPTFAPIVSPNPIAQNGTATVTPNGSDALSGFQSFYCDPIDTSVVGNFSINCTATDFAENRVNVSVSYRVVAAGDTTPPLITPNVVGILGQNGWYVGDVEVTWTVVDNESPISSQTSCTSQSVPGLSLGCLTPIQLGCNLQSLTNDYIGFVFICTATSAGGTNTQSVVIKRDTSVPIITFYSRTQPLPTSWINTNVLVYWGCQDSGSGFPDINKAISMEISTEGANQSATGTCTDNAGNSASDTQTGINIDKTPPTITLAGRTPANSNGWNNTDVTVQWNCADSLSGALESSLSETLTAEGANQYSFRTCVDNAGNQASEALSPIKIDKTPPILAPVVSPNPILQNGTATATPNATDPLSGIATQICDPVNTSNVGNFSVNCTATDLAGNTTVVPTNYQVISPDTTPPQITPNVIGTLGQNGWFVGDVQVSWSVVDNESAIGNSNGCQNQTVNQDTTGITFTCAATSAGGPSTNSVTIKRDTVAPMLAPVVNPNPVFINGTATASPNATDTLSGIVGQACSPVITSTVGNKSVDCSATDLAGNTANAPANYQVIYNFGGFFNPIVNPPNVNVIKAGKQVQLEFSLNGNFGLNIFAPGYPASGIVPCSSFGQPATLQPTVPQGPGLSYDVLTNQYRYKWRTDKAWEGTCRQFQMRLNDGTIYVANFQFTR